MLTQPQWLAQLSLSLAQLSPSLSNDFSPCYNLLNYIIHSYRISSIIIKVWHVISQVCNGVKDCPDGQDEDSRLQGIGNGDDGELDQPYAEHVRNWSLSHPAAHCNQLEASDCSLNIIIILLVIFVLVAINLAMIMASIF